MDSGSRTQGDHAAPSPADRAEGGRASLEAFLRTSGAPLLVLRAFLGVTFSFAGLQKLANPNFFRASAPGSFAEQLRGSILTSPLHHLLDFALHAPTLIAVVISLAELTVGLGTLLGCFSRLAALGGMLLSLTFFLTVSYSDSPYYYGADIVFLFAWTPFVLSEPGRLTLDTLLAERLRARVGSDGAASSGRREVLGHLSAAGAVAVLALITGGLTNLIGRKESSSAAPTPTTPALGGTTSTSTTPPAAGGSTPRGKKIGETASVAVGGAAPFTDPFQSIPAFVVQPTSGVFRAFSAICTHAGCQVQFAQSAEQFQCPCHGSIYNAATGAVVNGPAVNPLPAIEITVASDGGIYVEN